MSHLGDRLSALVDGELDGAELDRVHAHLAGCEQCRTEAAELRALKQKLRALMTGAPAEAAMTRRLIEMTGPGGPMPPRRRLLRVVPGRRAGHTRKPVGRERPGTAATWCSGPCPWSSAWARPPSRRAAEGKRPPGRGLPRRWRCTAWNTRSPPVGSRSPARRPRLGPTPRRRLREVRVFTLTCPVSRPARDHGAHHHGRDGRSPLLLAAALVVAVPGFLVAACSGQAGSSAAQNDAIAARAATGGKVPVARRRPDTLLAVRLLAQAAQAAIVTSYQGEEVVTRWSQSTGGSVLVSDIWHVSGGQTVTQTLDAGASSSSQPYRSSDDDGQAPEGVLGVTVPLVQLLETHYVVAYAGAGSAGDRTAQVVEARRADGSLAARFWLDDATKLPLEREVYDTAARVISRDVFINVRFAKPGSAPAGTGASADPQGPWTDPFSQAQLLALRARGWLVPAQLPGGLSLFTGAETEASTGTVLDLGYSDGLSVISVFEQRGQLPASLAGWRKTTVAGHPIFVAEPDQRSLTWSGRGMVYTVVADAPTQTVDAVVGALPHDKPPGFWKRMTRGMVRLASWVNPFR
jgi:sigma-E factor negative regulatory protein RseB